MEEVENRYSEVPKKEVFRLHIPYVLRFGIIWTAFFAIIGIGIQYFSVQDARLLDVIRGFFAANFLAWLQSFGNFSDVTIYATSKDFIYSLLGKWYYFLYTGGLLSLIWGLLSWIVHFEFVFKRKEKLPPIIQVVQPENVQPVLQTVSEPIQEKVPETFVYKGQRYELEEWVDEGLRLLAEKNIKEAELVYNQARRAYDPIKDPGQKVYKRILDFYTELVEEKNSSSNNKDNWEG